MTPGFAVTILAGVASLAFACSLLCGTALALGRGRLDELSPQAQARVLLAACLVPALASSAFSLAMVFDLAVLGCDEHGCSLHGASMPSVLFAGLAGLFAWRVGDRAKLAFFGVRLVRSMGRELDAMAENGAGPGVLPAGEPQAFVLGLIRPRIYLSRGLIRHTGRRDLESLIAHEDSHLRRRDPLRRWIASFGLAFHLPWIAGALERGLDAANEHAADADAARTLGDGRRIAEALVRLARLRVARPQLAVGVSGSNLESRVRELLTPRPRSERPGAVLLTVLALGVWAFALLAADQVHSAAEVLFRAIGS